jgi:DmsE family decaheme c-type cytochrome
MKQKLALKLLFGLALMWVPLTASAQKPQPSTSPRVAVSQAHVKDCLSCHGDEKNVTVILQSSMAVMGDPRTPMSQDGCQGCHGESKAHAAGKDDPPDVVFKGPDASPVAVRNQVCQGCHEGGMQINWAGSAHEVNNKACTDCHTAHAAKDPITVRFTQADKCFTCHSRERADSFKYSHHPMREGKVVCSDCHNPHGSPGDTKLLKEFTINETCYNCHADKRGPLLWEHQPVRENCLNCHNPHGSNEPRLMVERSNFLCSSCHSAQSNNSGGAFGGHASIPTSRTGSAFFNSALANQRTCVNCHSQVHGSNSPSGAFFFR